MKFDFEIVSAIQSKSLTVGEFIAHILPYNNYDDLSSNLSILLDMDFTSELKKFNKISVHDHINKLTADFQNRFGEIIESTKNTYELRHVFCHEFANTLNVNQEEIIRNFNNRKIFLEHTNNFIAELLYPNYPETQMDVNIHAGEKFEIKNSELENLIVLIKNLVQKDEFNTERFDEKDFDDSIVQWKEYRRLHAKI